MSKGLFGNFTHCGPKIKPVERSSFWRDDRPQPNSVHHGIYTPVLNTVRKTNGPFGFPAEPMAAPKKPRGTV
jgi:hypothetical protein